MELVQRGLFSKQTYRYDTTSLTIRMWDIITGTKEWSLRLDEISHRYESRKVGFFSGGCVFIIMIIVFSILLISNASTQNYVIVSLILVIPLILGRILNRYYYIELQTKRGPLAINCTHTTKTKVEEFVNGLIAASKQYFIWKYGTVDPAYNKEKQIENFRWLRNNEIITDEMYEDLKKQLEVALKK